MLQNNVFIAGCFGNTLTLGGSSGTFGINASQYQNSMTCGWEIQVETMKVNDYSACAERIYKTVYF